MDARRRHGAFQSASPWRSRPAAAGLSVCRPGRGREEPSAPFSISICPAARSWSATGRRSAISDHAIRPRISWANTWARILRGIYASADVFVFPSRTDTFGIVLLEGLASGLPVAAYPVTGPIDVVGDAGVLSNDLREAALGALNVDRAKARQRRSATAGRPARAFPEACARGSCWHARCRPIVRRTPLFSAQERSYCACVPIQNQTNPSISRCERSMARLPERTNYRPPS